MIRVQLFSFSIQSQLSSYCHLVHLVHNWSFYFYFSLKKSVSVFWLLLIHIYDHISISVSDSRFMHASLFLVISMLFLKSVIPCVKLVASFVQICVSLGKII